MPGNNPD